MSNKPDIKSEYVINEATGQRYLINKVGGVESINGGEAGLFVLDEPIGVARHRVIQVPYDTAPTLSGGGSAQWGSGVAGIEILGAYVSAGAVPFALSNFMVRYAIDPENDAASALMLPSAITPDGDADIFQVGAFNFTPITMTDGTTYVQQLNLPKSIKIPTSGHISRLDFRHNIVAGLTINMLIGAIEVEI